MKKYRCKICGYVFDEEKEGKKFEELESCVDCGVPTSLFEETLDDVKEEKKLKNAIEIYKENVSIDRNYDKCIDCGLCKTTCMEREDMKFNENSELCVNCGQCVQTCPVKALIPKRDIDEFNRAKESGKVMIAYTSPSTRVSFGDIFNLEPGTFTEEKLVGFLKSIGFDYVLDTNFAADLTIMEEASELVDRIKTKKTLPMFTSCCPAWIKYAEQFYPEIIDNISTCKSPIGMMGMVVKEYFTKINNIDKENVYTVAITPCTAKKYEIKREEIDGTDLVLTMYELEDYIKENNIKYEEIKESSFDGFKGSGAGIIFGNTGGVMEAALRTAYYLLTNKNLDVINFEKVRGYNGLREANIKINDLELKVAIIDGMSNAKKVLEDVKNNETKYDYIEIMNCVGGCIGGGGQPKINIHSEDKIKEKRIENLYNKDKNVNIRFSHENPEIKDIYKNFLIEPMSELSEELLHTSYKNRTNY